MLKPAHWLQLGRFAIVGASGYVVNLCVFAAGIAAGFHYTVAATLAFAVALVNNFVWNRIWTFKEVDGPAHAQALRFVVVSTGAFLVSLALLDSLVRAGSPKIPAQAMAIVAVTPVSFLANKLWSFRARTS